MMAETGQEGRAENQRGQLQLPWAARGLLCTFKAQLESQRPVTPAREAQSMHICGPQKACGVAPVARRPQSRQLRENKNRMQACGANPFLENMARKETTGTGQGVL